MIGRGGGYPRRFRTAPRAITNPDCISLFGRVRVNRKLIRRSLETHVLSVAKVKMHIETSGAGQAKDCANLFRFPAFSGGQIDEARHVLASPLLLFVEQPCGSGSSSFATGPTRGKSHTPKFTF